LQTGKALKRSLGQVAFSLAKKLIITWWRQILEGAENFIDDL
jgi:hypothetical protein